MLFVTQEYGMRRIRVYVAVPLTHLRDRERAVRICKYLRVVDAEVMSAWVAEEDAKQGLTAQEVYTRDISAIGASDAMLVEVSAPSVGVGMEVMTALRAGIPIACLHEKGSRVSWMVLGAPGVHFIPYARGSIDEALVNTAVWLRSLRSVPTRRATDLQTNVDVPEC